MDAVSRRSVVKGILAGSLGAFHIGCFSVQGRPIFSGSIKIAFLTDFHYSGGELQEDLWEKLIAHLTIERVDFIVGGGDWITDGPKLSNADARLRLQKFSSLWGSLQEPKILIAGNHDLVKNQNTELLTFQVFSEVFPEWRKNKRIDFQSWTLLVVQSIDPQGSSYRGYITDDQIDWIVEQLTQIPEDRELIVVTHIPFLTNLYQRTEGILYTPPPDQYVNNSTEFLDLFNRHSLRLVLQGHLHIHETIVWQDTVFITGGALCGKWWNGAHHGTPPGFRLIELKDGSVFGRYVSLANAS
jgi:3',5'-cyclic AMP phosphodiesterase CpdA